MEFCICNKTFREPIPDYLSIPVDPINKIFDLQIIDDYIYHFTSEYNVLGGVDGIDHLIHTFIKKPIVRISIKSTYNVKN